MTPFFASQKVWAKAQALFYRYATKRYALAHPFCCAEKTDSKRLARFDRCAIYALRARPPFSAQVRVQRICMNRSITSTTAEQAAKA